MKKYSLMLLLNFGALYAPAQEIIFQKQVFEASAVKAEVTRLDGKQVLKVERDLNILPFDIQKLGATVDEPTYVKLKNVSLENGTIEVKMLSKIQDPSPFPGAQGFIGVAFRINESNTAYESIYLRPKVGRSDNQYSRNHTVQYYSYPDFKFDKLRTEKEGLYETTAPVALNEWITLRIELNGQKAYLYINDAKYSTFVVDKMKGTVARGAIALWVDIGTIGYFKDLKISER